LYLNAEGVIPAAAVIKKGEKREKPFREKRRFDAANFSRSGNARVKEGEEDDEDEETLFDNRNLADMEG